MIFSKKRNDNDVLFSVVIPMRGSREKIHRCLNSVLQQEHFSESFEVIAVCTDKESFDASKEYASSIKCIYIGPSVAGVARNAGVMVATGQVLAFTDDDCVASPRWLYHASTFYARYGYSLFAGAVYWTVAYPSNIAECVDMSIHLKQREYTQLHGFGATCNLFVKRETFINYGGFRQDLISNEDEELCLRINSGDAIPLADDAIVYHPPRTSIRGLCAKGYRLGIGFAQSGDVEYLQLTLRKFILQQWWNKTVRTFKRSKCTYPEYTAWAIWIVSGLYSAAVCSGIRRVNG